MAAVRNKRGISFHELPTEIIALVASELDSTALFNLRLVCRGIHSASNEHFEKTFFHTRTHSLSQASLQTLKKISNHKSFGPSVRILRIGIQHLAESPLLQLQILNRFSLPDNIHANSVSYINGPGYAQRLAEQETFAQSGLDTSYLTQGLAQLSNCHSISICDFPEAWGTAAIRRDTGIAPFCGMCHVDSIKKVSRALHTAFAAICASNLALFELQLIFDEEGLHPEMLVLTDPIKTQIRLHFGTLRRLELSISPEQTRFVRSWIRIVTDFVGLFLALKEFDFVAAPPDDEGQLSHIFQELNIPQLRSIHIESITISEHTLQKFFLRHRFTLRRISLLEVTISDGQGSWQSLRKTIHERMRIKELFMPV